MAAVTAWFAAILALLPPLAVPLWVAARGRLPDRLAALQFASTIVLVMLALMSFAFDDPSWIDLPLTLAFLSLPGTLLLAICLERWM